MSSLAKSGVPGTMYKTLEDTILSDTTAVKLGAGYVTVPSGMNQLLGIWVHASILLPTADEALTVWGYLDSPDGINIKPFEFLFPVSGCADATTDNTNSTPGIYYPVNIPVVPGDRIECWATCYEANTGEAYATVTYWFGTANVLAPRALDDHPGRHRWRVVGHTPAASVVSGFGPEVQYQFSMGAAGGLITEVGGVVWTTTAATAQNGGATIQMNSDDIPLSPIEFKVNAYGSKLGAIEAHHANDCVTRRPVSCASEKVVHMDCEYLTDGGMILETGFMVSMVEFVRNGE